MKNYMPRIFDEILKFALESSGGVLICGPKACGKSSTAEQFAKTKIYMQDRENAPTYIKLAKLSPDKLLNFGDKPILIDEWQIISFIWDSIRFQIDQNNVFGQYILTGSTTPVFLKDSHSGTGRIVKKFMRPMSLFESKESSGEISLKGLFKNKAIVETYCNKTLDDYAFYICRGGWPLSINQRKDIALEQVKNYYSGLVNDDIFKVPNIGLEKNTQRAEKILKSYARGISSQMSSQSILNDCSNDETLNIVTLNKYLEALKELYIIEETEAWNPNLRSKTAIRSKNTRQFVDPSIASASLGLGPDSLFKDMNTFGFLFESLVTRDLRIYAEAMGAKVNHYRDKKDREIDLVIHLNNGDWGAIEVKLGDEEEVDKSAKKLLSLIDDFDLEKSFLNKPSFVAIITATNLAYQREDGVFVIPLATLAP